jgi:Family of unknown function (DUF6338)
VVPDTAVGLLLLVVAVLPGLTYTLAFERQAGAYGVTLADRTLRFIAVSAVFHVLAGWPEYWVWRTTVAEGGPVRSGQFAVLWAAAVLLLVLPAVTGTLVGQVYVHRDDRPRWQQGVLRWTLGPELAPRAWDDFFSDRPATYLRIRTVDGTTHAGLFASESYAAGFPQEPDLLLEEAWSLDPDSGELLDSLGYPLYIAPGQIAWMEIVPPQRAGSDHGPTEAVPDPSGQGPGRGE